MLLMASIGMNAGGGIVDGLLSVGPVIIACAVLVAIIPLMVGYLIGRKLLKMNPVLLLGSLTGAMTSTPALAVITAKKSGINCSNQKGARSGAPLKTDRQGSDGRALRLALPVSRRAAPRIPAHRTDPRKLSLQCCLAQSFKEWRND